VVGDVMGRFHPHGDTAIYDALVRLGQDFSLSHVLIDKHGNFGSPADPPAAQRYTECRLSVLATEMLAGIDEGTVDFEPSYDASDQEPVVLPSRFPNLLVNGNQGIAVGMATNIPPHNLGEICDAAVMLIERPETTLDQLMEVVRGPDFPTGALIMGSVGIADAYRTGRGSIRLRAVTSIEPSRRGPAIVVTEIPYQTSVDLIAGTLAEAVESGRIEGVRDIRNESGQGSTRLVIELRADANPQIVLNNLYKHTQAQITFSINMVALVDGVPRTINLAQALQEWVDHQVVVVTRRTRYRLEKTEARLHIIEGLVKALDQIDAIVALIKASKDRAAARVGLMGAGFEYSEIQANHILDLALGRLTQLGRDELVAERKELSAEVKKLRKILAQREVLMGVIRDELVAIRDAHRCDRRTQIVADDRGEIATEALVVDEPIVVTVTARGYVQSRPGQGRGRAAKTAEPGERDALAQSIETSTLSGLMFFSDRGRAYRLTAHDIPKGRLTAAPNLFQMGDSEQIVAVIDANVASEHENVVFVTAQGGVKRTALSEFVDAGSRRDGIVAMKLVGDDRVVAVFPGWDEFETLVVTREGQGIRFGEAEVRAVGRAAGGIRAIRLRGDDRVIGGCAVAHEETVVIATDAGFAKRLRVDELAVQARGGAGVRVMRLDRRRGAVVALAPAAERTVFVLGDSAVSVATTELKIAARDSVGSAVPGLPAGAVVSRVVPASAPPDDTAS
jgi:DNA gyrase subunit A